MTSFCPPTLHSAASAGPRSASESGMPPAPQPSSSSVPKLAAGALALAIVGVLLYRLSASETPKPSAARSSGSESAELAGGAERHHEPSSVSDPGTEADGGADRGGYFARFGWGSGAGKLGKDRPDEANPEGPMSFAPLPGGGLAILDQINGRMVLTDKDGKPVKEIKVDLQAPQEIAVGKDGSMAVADRLVDKRVNVYDANGKSMGSLPLEGNKIKEGGAVSGLFVDGKNVYAENAHGILALLGSTDGKAADKQTDLFGRPSRDGTLLLSAGITNAQQGRAWVSAMKRAETRELFTRELKENVPILTISMLDSDQKGTIYIAYTTELGENDERLVLHCLAPTDGHILGSVEVQLNDMPEETFREFSVADDGTVYHAEMSEQGMSYRAIHCP